MTDREPDEGPSESDADEERVLGAFDPETTTITIVDPHSERSDE